MANNSVALSSNTIGGVPIPLSGDGVVAEINPDAPFSATDGVSQKIFNQMNNPGGIITITCFPQDAAFKVLYDLFNASQASNGILSLAGECTTLEYTASWDGAAFTALPTLRREQDASTTSFELTLNGLNTVPL
jgi:hypothetical protein